MRHTAGGISLFVGVFFVLPGLIEVLPSSTANAIHPYLPSSAGGAIAQALPDPHMFSPWGGFALFCGYTAVTIVIAAWLLLSATRSRARCTAGPRITRRDRVCRRSARPALGRARRSWRTRG